MFNIDKRHLAIRLLVVVAAGRGSGALIYGVVVTGSG